MSGFFDTSGLGATEDFGGSNNAANDFARASGSNPGQFSSDGLFDRLFGSKKKAKADAAMVSPIPPPAPEPVTSKDRPAPAISSAKSLVQRITQGSAGQLVPGTQMTPSEYALAIVKATTPPPPSAPPPGAPAPQLPPYQGIPQFPNPQPPARYPAPPLPLQSPPRPPQMSGSPYGAPMDNTPFAGSLSSPPQQSPIPNPILQRMLALGSNRSTPPGYFSGGPIHLMRGGYPAHLMMGLPERFATGGPGGDFVPGDGHGDGRSDHIDAKLSPGEFVEDAETVALMGNGDSDAGARGYEAIREAVRKEKGKALAKGKFSPNAKSPEHYAKIGMRAAAAS